jgi:hypothetical protein
MNPTTEQLADAALALPDGDRMELVETLIASLRSEDRAPFDESWREVIQQRTATLIGGGLNPSDEDIRLGRIKEFSSMDDLIADLDQPE